VRLELLSLRHLFLTMLPYSRVNISTLFRSVNLELPPAELGWDTATVEIGGQPFELELDAEHRSLPWAASGTNITLSVTDSSERISKSTAEVEPGSGKVQWTFDQLRQPVYTRYGTSLLVMFGGGGSVPGLRSDPQAIAVLPLSGLTEGKEHHVETLVVIGKHLGRLKQNAFTDFTERTHQCKVVGKLRLMVNIDPGLDMNHEKYTKSPARRHAFETW